MKTIILYETKYNTTEYYARLLAQRYRCETVHCDQINEETLNTYEHIIWGMPMYFSKPKGYKNFAKTIANHLDKKITVFIVGGTRVDEIHISDLKQKFIDPVSNNIVFNYYQGIITKEALGFLDKKIYAMLLKSFQSKHEDQLNLLEQSLRDLSETDRSIKDCVIE